jgi:hypothetical protein
MASSAWENAGIHGESSSGSALASAGDFSGKLMVKWLSLS